MACNQLMWEHFKQTRNALMWCEYECEQVLTCGQVLIAATLLLTCHVTSVSYHVTAVLFLYIYR